MQRWRLRGRYDREVRRRLSGVPPAPHVLTGADLTGLPEPVRTWVERTGAVGRPRVWSFHAHFRARIRGGPDEPWMEGTAEQHEFFHPPARLFFMKVRRAGLPVRVFHRYAEGAATMEGRLLGVFPVLDVSGAELTRSETVTLLNDMFFLAPGALVDAPIRWEALEGSRVRATYANFGHTVSAVVHFDAEGDLVDFESRDRYQMDGEAARLIRWSTPVPGYVELAGHRLPAGGEACWGEPGEEWSYADFALEAIEYNVAGEGTG